MILTYLLIPIHEPIDYLSHFLRHITKLLSWKWPSHYYLYICYTYLWYHFMIKKNDITWFTFVVPVFFAFSMSFNWHLLHLIHIFINSNHGYHGYRKVMAWDQFVNCRTESTMIYVIREVVVDQTWWKNTCF